MSLFKIDFLVSLKRCSSGAYQTRAVGMDRNDSKKFLPSPLTFSEGTGMDNLVQAQAEVKELKYEHYSGSTESTETN